ncbi:hypothetical protein A3Q56_02912 [Intoshia linei]|uniref:Plus3 domain-containing protein n=1 Tax=Intoshia linei TaxID=1819745 RepID=A0A177B6R4_9BILA|nr:hypothetical protein A3Q56_02912 [Intoshia linei]
MSRSIGNKSKKQKKKIFDEMSSLDGSDVSSDDYVYSDGYGDDLIGDLQDREHLNLLTEIEREMELFKRSNERDARKKRHKLLIKIKKKNLKINQVGDSDSDSNASEAYDEGEIDEFDSIRKSHRVSQKENVATSALKNLKEARNRQSKSSTHTDFKSSEIYTYDDESDSLKSCSDDACEEPKVSGIDYIEKIEDLTKVKLSRYKLEKWCHMPFLNKVAIGMFVKIGIGSHYNTPIYKIFEIVDITKTTRIYQFGNSRTNKGLVLRFGKTEKVFRFEFVSNQPFKKVEFENWIQELKKCDIKSPTIEFLDQKEKDIKKALSYNLTTVEIDHLVRDKSEFETRPSNIALHKSNLFNEIAKAQEINDQDRIATLQAKLVDLEDYAKTKKKRFNSMDATISKINERNREINMSQAEEALRLDYLEDQKTADNPFKRRKCMPQLVTKARLKQLTQPVVPVTEEIDELVIVPEPEQTISPPKNSNSLLYDIHDFDVSIDISLPSTDSTTTDITKEFSKNMPIFNTKTEDSIKPSKCLDLKAYKKLRVIKEIVERSLERLRNKTFICMSTKQRCEGIGYVHRYELYKTAYALE